MASQTTATMVSSSLGSTGKEGDTRVGTSTNCSASCGSETEEREGMTSLKILGTSITCSTSGKELSRFSTSTSCFHHQPHSSFKHRQDPRAVSHLLHGVPLYPLLRPRPPPQEAPAASPRWSLLVAVARCTSRASTSFWALAVPVGWRGAWCVVRGVCWWWWWCVGGWVRRRRGARWCVYVYGKEGEEDGGAGSHRIDHKSQRFRLRAPLCVGNTWFPQLCSDT